MKFEIHSDYNNHKQTIKTFFNNFNNSGTLFIDGDRNKIKLFDLEGQTINIKSFKVPNLFNQLVYKYYRKSKAKRSFEHAKILMSKNIGTPKPVAYLETYNFFGIQESFYASQHLLCDLTFRDLVEQADYPDHETILRQFTRFSFDLHQKGIEFKDHSPGNTLIKKVSQDDYDFYLVDLNRMQFHKKMSFSLRMKNLSRLTPKKEMVAIMSDEYAKCADLKSEQVFSILWKLTSKFQEKYYRKIRIKKELGLK